MASPNQPGPVVLTAVGFVVLTTHARDRFRRRFGGDDPAGSLARAVRLTATQVYRLSDGKFINMRYGLRDAATGALWVLDEHRTQAGLLVAVTVVRVANRRRPGPARVCEEDADGG
jgi:hypothetical protein